MSPRRLANAARGEVTVRLGGQEVRLCVTLGALAELEGYFQVSGFEGLAERLKGLGAGDLLAVLQALSVDAVDFLNCPWRFQRRSRLWSRHSRR